MQKLKQFLHLRKEIIIFSILINLLSYYWPKSTKTVIDTTIFSVPEYEVVSSAAFSRKPAVFQHKKAAEYYLKLAKEYFLYE